ncbi:MAG: hypothetical protein RJQ00_09750 [Vicingaceae bacterium]
MILRLPHITNFLGHYIDQGYTKSADLHYGVSRLILSNKLGEEWCSKNVKPKTDFGKKEKGNRKFLQVDKTIKSRMTREYFEKVCRLAKLLINLQEVKGFEIVIDRIKKDSIQSNYAELQAALFCITRGFDVEFTLPSFEKTKDFDLLINKNNLAIPCEVKSKNESEQYSLKSILNSITKAKKQLPKDKIGIIFIRLSKKWIHESDFKEIITHAFNSERVGSICLSWDEIITPHDELALTYTSFLAEIKKDIPADISKTFTELFKKEASYHPFNIQKLIEGFQVNCNLGGITKYKKN